jgi:ferredoxin-NADP reductase
METMIPQLAVRVAQVECLTPCIKRLTLVPLVGSHLPGFASGDQIRVCQLYEGRRVWNAYTLVSSPLDTRCYEIVVKGRPAHIPCQSRFLCHVVQAGDGICISPPVTGMRLATAAGKHLLVAGGMGITAFLAHLAALRSQEIPYELHYTYRSPERALFADELRQAHGDRLKCNDSQLTGRLDTTDLLAGQPARTHLYVGGPPAFVKDLVAAAEGSGWPRTALHCDAGLMLDTGFTDKKDNRPPVPA